MYTTSDEHAADMKLVIMRATTLHFALTNKAPSALVEEARIDLGEALVIYYKPKEKKD